ncbi:MAG TPA: dihydrofolate reductase family protein [Flavisolibacter sp.]|nr:dihydrofolate reductase family protein [Flavisolibacter sp.]
MRKIVSGFACSLDGYIEGPNGEMDWILIDKEINFTEQMKRFDAFFYGRKSYETVLKMGAITASGNNHYVFSNSLKSTVPGYTLLQGNIKEEVLKLKQIPGKDIAVFGGANLLASLFNLELVDELSIAVIPVLLGKGKPMVDVLSNRVWLSLIKTHIYSNGTVQLTYAVKDIES